MARIVWIAAIVLAACSSATVPIEDETPAIDPPRVLSASALPRMTSEAKSLDAEQVANEVAHPDDMGAMLEAAGFASASQRSFGGGTGAFSRVLARRLAFTTATGAQTFVGWFGDHAGEEIVTARRIAPEGVPRGVVLFRHLPDGCCHNDVPVFLAAWQRGSTVLYLHVGGRRANVRAFTELIESYDREV
ncbi:MAG: hypothetical protein OEV60_07135 [Actinomycetota bacterium]|nr:hypothetical protein [Actinomycetota bacterium]MDH5225239.1 hypothetical protein [Actinomycetota bacterium]MDH5312712.1 hypothetical protein [Actinomycetota bacterium]